MWERRPRREALGLYRQESPFRHEKAQPCKSTKAYRRALASCGSADLGAKLWVGTGATVRFAAGAQLPQKHQSTKAPKHQSTKAYRRSLPHVGAPTSARIQQAGVESVLEFSEPLQEGFFILHDEAQLVGLGQLRTRARPRDHNTGLGRDGT